MKAVNLESFLKEESLFDVRSPSEFAKGHIPGSINSPLLSDEERAVVGTTYHQSSRSEAITLGLELVEPKIESMIEAAEEKAAIYCWRGGMRSGSVARLLEIFGVSCICLKNGYKSYRRAAHLSFEKPLKLRVLGGFTGCGKTEKLAELKKNGEQVIDLERLANHRGSSFGHMGAQPSQEQFENLLAWELFRFDDKPIWIENESRLIGSCKIPDPLFKQMQDAPKTIIECSKEKRVERLLAAYGDTPRKELIEATERIRKRLGGERTKNAIKAIENGMLRDAIELVLEYYDSTYGR